MSTTVNEFSSLIGSSQASCFRSRISKKRTERKNLKQVVLAVEDDKFSRTALERFYDKFDLELELILVNSWLEAIPFLDRAAFIIVDWFIQGSVSMVDLGLDKELKKRGVPFVVWSGSPEAVPSDLPFLNKCNVAGLKATLEEHVPHKQGNE